MSHNLRRGIGGVCAGCGDHRATGGSAASVGTVGLPSDLISAFNEFQAG